MRPAALCASLVSGLLLAALPGAAHAQVRGGDPDGGIPRPMDMRPMGVQMGKYGGGPPPMIQGDEQCKPDGCIVIINKSAGFDVTEFYINDGKLDPVGAPVWGANQFKGFRLNPSRAVWTPRPGKMNCSLVVRVVLRDRETRDVVEGIEPFDMCELPKSSFAVLEIDMKRPRVILEDGG